MNRSGADEERDGVSGVADQVRVPGEGADEEASRPQDEAERHPAPASHLPPLTRKAAAPVRASAWGERCMSMVGMRSSSATWPCPCITQSGREQSGHYRSVDSGVSQDLAKPARSASRQAVLDDAHRLANSSSVKVPPACSWPSR